MKKMLLLVFALLLIGWSQVPAAMADSIGSGDYVKLTAYNSLDAGGIMKIDVSHNLGNTVAFTYDTFCIQDNVYITPGVWYPVAAISSNVGFFDQGIAGGGALKGQVNYLYHRYEDGVYASYFNNSSTGASNQADFQRTLWSLQGSGPSYAPTPGTPWAIDLANYNDSSNGLQHPWGTAVINIVSGYNNGQFTGPDVQNLLDATVPEPATMLLLGSGLLGLVGLGRKFKK